MGKQVAPGLFSLVLMLVLLLVHSGVEAEPETHAHAMDDPLIGRVLVDQLEWQDTEPWSTLHFDANAWLGTDKDRAVFRSEGSLMDGQGRTSAPSCSGPDPWRPGGIWSVACARTGV